MDMTFGLGAAGIPFGTSYSSRQLHSGARIRDLHLTVNTGVEKQCPTANSLFVEEPILNVKSANLKEPNLSLECI